MENAARGEEAEWALGTGGKGSDSATGNDEIWVRPRQAWCAECGQEWIEDLCSGVGTKYGYVGQLYAGLQRESEGAGLFRKEKSARASGRLTRHRLRPQSSISTTRSGAALKLVELVYYRLLPVVTISSVSFID